MDITKFKQELNEFIQAFTEPDSWQNLNIEKQNIIIERALADITAHAKNVNFYKQNVILACEFC